MSNDEPEPLFLRGYEPKYGEILGAVARGWTHPQNHQKTMDVDLAQAIADEVQQLYRELL